MYWFRRKEDKKEDKKEGSFDPTAGQVDLRHDYCCCRRRCAPADDSSFLFHSLIHSLIRYHHQAWKERFLPKESWFHSFLSLHLSSYIFCCSWFSLIFNLLLLSGRIDLQATDRHCDLTCKKMVSRIFSCCVLLLFLLSLRLRLRLLHPSLSFSSSKVLLFIPNFLTRLLDWVYIMHWPQMHLHGDHHYAKYNNNEVVTVVWTKFSDNISWRLFTLDEKQSWMTREMKKKATKGNRDDDLSDGNSMKIGWYQIQTRKRNLT